MPPDKSREGLVPLQEEEPQGEGPHVEHAEENHHVEAAQVAVAEGGVVENDVDHHLVQQHHHQGELQDEPHGAGLEVPVNSPAVLGVGGQLSEPCDRHEGHQADGPHRLIQAAVNSVVHPNIREIKLTTIIHVSGCVKSVKYIKLFSTARFFSSQDFFFCKRLSLKSARTLFSDL